MSIKKENNKRAEKKEKQKRINFYKTVFRGDRYSRGVNRNHPHYKDLITFIKNYNLHNKKVLEIGSGLGTLQDIVDDYTGIDITESLRKYYHKPYITVRNNIYPFPDNTFDGVFSRAVFEHIPNIEMAVKETLRVLKPNGVWLFAPAWHVRSWATEGYTVRPYKELNIKEKLVKFSILWREVLWYRALVTLFKRVFWTLQYLLDSSSFVNTMPYKKLKANYDIFWESDSDACNSVDPYAAILFFRRNKCEVVNYNLLTKAILLRSSYLVIRKLS